MKNCQRISFTLGIVMLFTLVNLVSFALAIDDEAVSASLGGLKSIYIAEPSIDSQVRYDGLSTRRLKKNTDRQISKSGIKALSEKEFDRLKRSERYPLGRLDTVITVSEITSMDLKIYNIVVQLRQVVFLARKPVAKLWAPTWGKRELGYSGNVDVVEERVKDIVGQFINDYLSANQK